MSFDRLQTALDDLARGHVPVPPEDMIFVGDGDYLKISAEFLAYVVDVGGLQPHHHVLDLGSGIGRIAAGVSRYLDPVEGRYIGFDPVKSGIDWCRQTYADQPHMRFEWADIYNELYRPDGTIIAPDYQFPCQDGSIDLAIVTSVFTHLYEPEIGAYLAELDRVLKPGGRLFSTAYLFHGSEPQQGVAPHLKFNVEGKDGRHRWHVAGMPPLSAVCYSEEYFNWLFQRRMGREPEIRRGRWRGEAGPWFQDLVLL
jgi:ubiquinone/menaquinone biosynthesis C-methylase UbiE